MSATRILPVAVRNAGDLATICAGEGAKSDPLWERAIKAKRQWVRDRLAEMGTFAWVAYNGADPIGMIQCHPDRDGAGVGVAVIDCIWVPKKSRWGRGIAASFWLRSRQRCSASTAGSMASLQTGWLLWPSMAKPKVSSLLNRSTCAMGLPMSPVIRI